MALKRRHFRKLPDHSRPQLHLSLLGALALIGTWRLLAAEVGTSKDRGKQWLTTPKNLPRNAACQSLYRSPDWALVSAKTGPRAEYNNNNNNNNNNVSVYASQPSSGLFQEMTYPVVCLKLRDLVLTI
jgi:hypothetical protein